MAMERGIFPAVELYTHKNAPCSQAPAKRFVLLSSSCSVTLALHFSLKGFAPKEIYLIWVNPRKKYQVVNKYSFTTCNMKWKFIFAL